MSKSQFPTPLACAGLAAVSLLASTPTLAQSACSSEVVLGELSAGVPGPTLWTPDGAPVIGGAFSYQVQGGPAGARGVLFLGHSVAAPGPGAGPIFSPGNVFRRIPFELDASGASLSLFDSAAVQAEACGREIVAQAVMRDPTQAGMARYTNAIRAVAGVPVGPLFPGTRLTVGAGPRAVATGDLNGDGILDLVVANNGSGDVSVLLGLGERAYEAAASYDTGSSPRSVALEDLDLDGNLDLAVAVAADAVAILLGDGDGSFGAATSISLAIGAGPEALVTGDLDGDGSADLAVANGGSNDVSILLGLGDGSFAAPVNYGTGSGPVHLLAADFDADGALDLVVVNKLSDDLAVLLGKGDGAFSAAVNYGVGGSPTAVATGDLTGDGVLDLAVSNKASDDVSALFGVGDGTFGAASFHPSGNGPASVGVGDLDGDGVDDILSASGQSRDVTVLLSSLSLQFNAPQRYKVGGNPGALTLADLDGDGSLDVTVANKKSNDLSLLPGLGDGKLEQAKEIGLGFNVLSLALADLNEDGIGDLITTKEFASTAGQIRLGVGGGAYGAVLAKPAGLAGYDGLSATDLNGDGHIDLVAFAWTSREVSVVLGKGDGKFGASQQFPTPEQPRELLIGDLNSDGVPDLLVLTGDSATTPNHWVLPGNGDGTYGAAILVPTLADAWGGALGDLDGDGFQDLVTASTMGLNSLLLVQLGNGDGTFQAATQIGTGGLGREVAIADLDGDGYLDLAAVSTTALPGQANTNVYELSVVLGAGDGSFGPVTTTHVATSPSAQWVSLAIGDLDGNGIPDVAVTLDGRVSVAVLLGKGDGMLAPPLLFGTGKRPIDLVIHDLDGDGILDLAVANFSSAYLSLLTNLVGE